MLLIDRLFTRWSHSEFLRNVTTMFSGTICAQFISVLSATVLYRIYDQDEYGTLGVYLALAGMLNAFCTLQYLEAILIEKSEEDAKNVLCLARIINLAVTVVSAFGVFIFASFISDWLNAASVKNWLYFIPVSVFFNGQNMILRVWGNRQKRYKLLSIGSILASVSIPFFAILFSFVFEGEEGLFIGMLASQILPTLYLYFNQNRIDQLKLWSLNINQLFFYASKHINFLKFSLPATFLIGLSSQLPVFVLSRFAGIEVVAFYNLSVRVLELPVLLVSGSVGNVFRQRAVEDYAKYGNCREIFLKTLYTLFMYSWFPFLIFLIFAPYIFEIIFGSDWSVSGKYAQALGLMYYANFIVGVLSYLYYINKKQKEDFMLRIPMLISMFFALYLGLSYSIMGGLIAFSMTRVVFYLFVLFRVNVFSKGLKVGS